MNFNDPAVIAESLKNSTWFQRKMKSDAKRIKRSLKNPTSHPTRLYRGPYSYTEQDNV